MPDYQVYSKETGACVVASLAAADPAEANTKLDAQYPAGDPFNPKGDGAAAWATLKEK